MAVAHSDLARIRYDGERALVEQLSNLDDAGLHLWFGLDYVPGVADIDLLLYHRERGAFVVEVKAVELYQIREYGLLSWELLGARHDVPPQMQARTAMLSLLTYLRSHRIKAPWLTPTVCWPRISRAAWRDVWDDPVIGVELAEGMLFLEDIADPAALSARLAQVALTPPIGRGTGARHLHSDEYAAGFDAVFARAAARRVTRVDAERLEPLTGVRATQGLAFAPANASTRMHLTGHPGSGKTNRLLQIGLGHARAGKSVLLVCFNKTLGAELRRLMDHHLGDEAKSLPFHITDVFDMASGIWTARRLPYFGGGGYDEWGAEAVRALAAHPKYTGVYDTVLIDEAQDFHDWMYDLAVEQAVPDPTVIVSVSSDQRLYSTPEWVEEFRRRPGTTNRRRLRNHRNYRAVFVAAHAFAKAYPNPDRIAAALALPTSRSRDGVQREMEFTNPGAEGVTVLRALPSAPGNSDAADELRQYEREWTEQCARVLQMELDALPFDCVPRDLLVLTATTDDRIRSMIVRSLVMVEADYIDYVTDDNRRAVAGPDMVRVSTFHSARGLEAERVVVFGFGRLENGFASHGDPKMANKLGYVALSRSHGYCTVVTTTRAQSLPILFLESIITEMARVDADGTGAVGAA